MFVIVLRPPFPAGNRIGLLKPNVLASFGGGNQREGWHTRAVKIMSKKLFAVSLLASIVGASLWLVSPSLLTSYLTVAASSAVPAPQPGQRLACGERVQFTLSPQGGDFIITKIEKKLPRPMGSRA